MAVRYLSFGCQKSLKSKLFLDTLKFAFILTIGIFGGFLFKGLKMLAVLNDSSEQVTMTSLELVNFINQSRKQGESEINHSDFLKKVLKVLNGIEGKFSSYYIASNGKQNPCYKFPKREACLMAMSYSYELQAKVFDRMTALEALQAPKFKVPATLSEALRLAANQAETIEKQTIELKQQKPAVEFVDQYVKTNSSKTISEVAKILKVGQKDFFAWLENNKVIFQRGNTWLPAATYAKYFNVKTGLTKAKEPKNYTQTRFTPAGIVWIAKKLDAYNKQGKLL